MTRLGFYIIHNNQYKLVKTINVPWDFTIGGPDSDNPIIDKPIIGEWEPMKYVLFPDNIAYEDEYQIIVKEKVELAPSEQKETTKLYRVTYGDTGIFDAVRRYMTAEEWTDFLNNENVNWLYKPDYYEKSYISYFTGEGYKSFKEKTLPLILQIFQEENITTSILEVIRDAGVVDDDSSSPDNNEEDPGQGDVEQPKPRFEDWITGYFYNVLFEEKGFFDIFNTNRTYFIIAEEDISAFGFMITYKGRTIVNFEEHDYRNIINAMHPNIRKDMITQDESFGGYDEDKQFPQDKNKTDESFGGYDEDSSFLV